MVYKLTHATLYEHFIKSFVWRLDGEEAVPKATEFYSCFTEVRIWLFILCFQAKTLMASLHGIKRWGPVIYSPVPKNSQNHFLKLLANIGLSCEERKRMSPQMLCTGFQKRHYSSPQCVWQAQGWFPYFTLLELETKWSALVLLHNWLIFLSWTFWLVCVKSSLCIKWQVRKLKTKTKQCTYSAALIFFCFILNLH